MNQRDSLNQARTAVFAALQQSTALHNILAMAINATPTSTTRNALTEVNIRLGELDAMLNHASDDLTDMLKKEIDK